MPKIIHIVILAFAIFSGSLACYAEDSTAPASNDEATTSLEDVDEKPRILKFKAPKYPEPLFRRGIEGRVIVEFILSKKGKVYQPKVIDSDHTLFNLPALESVKRTKFKPAKLNGKKVACRLRVPIRFSLEPPPAS